MFDALNSIIRCTTASNTIQILSHVAIKGGFVHAFNGRMYATAKMAANPLGLDNVCVKADMLMAALRVIGNDKAKTAIDAEHGTLKITSKRYRAQIPVRPIEDFYIQEMPSRRAATSLDFNLAASLQLLRPIVGDNPSLPWAQGFLLENGAITVTNALVLAKQLVGSMKLPATIITAEFADELIAQGAEVEALSVQNGRATAWLGNGAVISSVIIDGVWPRSFDAIMAPVAKGAKFTAVPDGIEDAIQCLLPFSAENKTAVVTLSGSKVELVSSETAAASIDVDGLDAKAPCSVNVGHVQTALRMANEWDLTKSPIPFRNKEWAISGAIAGVRV